jgi:branched-chain amino acid transport system substrate-binding protein
VNPIINYSPEENRMKHLGFRQASQRPALSARPRALPLIALSALGLVIAACSSGNGTTASPASGSVAAHTSRCAKQGAPITIATVGTQSGPIAETEAPGPLAFKAWVAQANASGGINCHPIRYLIEDDKGNPAENLALVKEMVEQDHVVAFVAMDAAETLEASESYLAASGIPVIGGDPAWDFYYTHQNFYPQIPMGAQNTKIAFGALSTYGKRTGKTKIGVLTCQEIAGCTNLYSDAPADAKGLGLDLTYRVETPLTTTSYTAQCLAAKSAGVQILFMAMTPAAEDSIAAACNQVGFDPVYSTFQNSTSPQMLQDPNLNGMIVPIGTAPWFDTSDPGVAEFQSALKRYGDGLAPSGVGMTGWVAAQLFATAAKSIAATATPSSALITQGLDHVSNDDLGGIAGPLTFHAGQDAPDVDCWWVVQFSGGKTTTLNNGQRSCAS